MAIGLLAAPDSLYRTFTSRRGALYAQHLGRHSWVGIHEGCDITYNINDCDGIYLTVSARGLPLQFESQPFEFYFDTEALREFLTQGGKALAEVDARRSTQ